MERPFAVTVLAILNFLGGLVLLGFAALFAIGATAAAEPDAAAAPIVLAVCAVIAGGLGIFQFVTGVGLWTLKNYGRICQLILSGIGLLGIPIGTIVSAVILYYLTRPGVQLLFSGRPEYSLTPDERQIVARDANQALALVIVLIVAVFGGIAMIGIVAAIAIPALLRARISANEASAIGTVRTFVSAQAAWAGSHAGAYATPACLHDPASCGETGATTVYLDRDPTAGEPRSGYRYGFAPRAPVAVEAPAPDPTMPNIEGMTPEQLASHVADMQAKADAQAAQAAAAAPGGYAIWAVPQSNATGIRSFCADETGIVLQYGPSVVWADPQGDAARCPEGGEPVH
jgi:hypothetical protein